jgi:hypothetical protein
LYSQNVACKPYDENDGFMPPPPGFDKSGKSLKDMGEADAYAASVKCLRRARGESVGEKKDFEKDCGNDADCTKWVDAAINDMCRRSYDPQRPSEGCP